MHLLITVGTTKFENMINIVLQNIKELTNVYSKVTIQTGLMKVENTYNISNLEIYSFIDNLDISIYDVILCHCGTGSILSGLAHNKKVVAVINDTLKDNHQKETSEVFETFVYIKTLEDFVPFLLQKNFPKRMKYNAKRSCSFLHKLISK